MNRTDKGAAHKAPGTLNSRRRCQVVQMFQPGTWTVQTENAQMKVEVELKQMHPEN